MQNKENKIKRLVEIHKSRLKQYSNIAPEVITYYGELSEATYVPPKVVKFLCKVYLKDLKKLCKYTRKATEFAQEVPTTAEQEKPHGSLPVVVTDKPEIKDVISTDGLVAEKIVMAAVLAKEEE